MRGREQTLVCSRTVHSSTVKKQVQNKFLNYAYQKKIYRLRNGHVDSIRDTIIYSNYNVLGCRLLFFEFYHGLKSRGHL